MAKKLVKQITVRSETDRRRKYTLNIYSGGSMTCSCPGWVFCRPEGGCKHIKKVKKQIRARRSA